MRIAVNALDKVRISRSYLYLRVYGCIIGVCVLSTCQSVVNRLFRVFLNSAERNDSTKGVASVKETKLNFRRSAIVTIIL